MYKFLHDIRAGDFRKSKLQLPQKEIMATSVIFGVEDGKDSDDDPDDYVKESGVWFPRDFFLFFFFYLLLHLSSKYLLRLLGFLVSFGKYRY